MPQWRLGAEFVVKSRSLLRLRGNVAPAWQNDKRIVSIALQRTLQSKVGGSRDRSQPRHERRRHPAGPHRHLASGSGVPEFRVHLKTSFLRFQDVSRRFWSVWKAS